MRVKLRVLGGASEGKALTIRTEKYVIGRDDNCDLRPRSDMVSRRHCLLSVSESQITIEDLGSRNGTYLNGQLLDAPTGLQSGDHIKIGPLEFEVDMDLAGRQKQPQVKDIQDVAARTADQSSSQLDIGDWLEEFDEAERQSRMEDPETRHFKMDDTASVTLNGDADGANETVMEDESKENKQQAKAEKTTPGKLPRPPKQESKNSQEAAQDMLKKFFTRG